MAFATEDFGWGKVEILYDGSPTRNLHIATVRLENTSSMDLTSLNVDIVANQGTMVLRSRGQLADSAQSFAFRLEYQEIIGEANKRELTQQELAYWGPRAEFSVPVLNRDGVATFTLLLSRNDYATPLVALYCVHAGVRVEHRPPEREARRATIAGIVTASIIAIAAYFSPLHSAIVLAITWLVAAFALTLGAWVVKAGRAIASLAA